MNYIRICYFLFFNLILLMGVSCSSKDIYVYADNENDLCLLLKSEGYSVHLYDDLDKLMDEAPENAGVCILSTDYPVVGTTISRDLMNRINEKNIRCFAEFVNNVDGIQLAEEPIELKLERGVVISHSISDSLPVLSILGLNRSFLYPIPNRESLLVAAKVVGFDKAELGLDSTLTYPLLFNYSDHLLVSTTKLSNFATARFSPEVKWKYVFQHIINWVSNTEKNRPITHWLSYVNPMYNREEKLPSHAREIAIKKGVDWFFKGKFLLSEESYSLYRKYESDWPYGPGPDQSVKVGDGSMGILEGHGSIIHLDGKQDYRYWSRNDVQGEVALALSLAGDYLKDTLYSNVSKRIMRFAFDSYRNGVRNDIHNPNYGLMSWTSLHPDVYYGDDNARALLGYIYANNQLNDQEINRKIAECIIANFRTSSKEGYKGAPAMLAQDIERNGWKYYHEKSYVNPHPHFESWIWACYLWLYDKTQYQPLFDKALKGISTTMEAYPQKWHWTNGIQQERARMILPLAWLVRIDPSAEHVRWLNLMIDDLLKNQVSCGAIQEQMGDPSLNYVGIVKSNADYGKYEASLIYENGDLVSDMLYTTNFAFFGLNEAVKLTGNPAHIEALNRISDFLIRIQVSSSKYPDLDGAWFRAFNFKNWDYWADNADNGWGAWCTLTGWIQSWIISTQILMDRDSTYWDLTRDSQIGLCMGEVVNQMLNE